MTMMVPYHSAEWGRLVTPRYAYGIHNGLWAWVTWSVDNGIATLKWSRL